jgi:hypothetical protein
VVTEHKAIHAYLSAEGKDVWDDFSTEAGVSLTGLLEAIAQTLLKEVEKNGGDFDGLHPDWVKLARRIDASRRRRGR